MKKKIINSKTNLVFPVILVSSALIVLFNFKDKLFPKNIEKTNDNNSSNQNLKQTDEDVDTTTFQKLSLLTNRCRGCGKCTRIDPEHFELIGDKASIISTKNLDSQNLKLAIDNCPAQAIVLEQ